MEQIKLSAISREKTGKQICKKIRRDGWTPGVIYGRKIKPMNLSVPTKIFTEIIRENPGALVELNLRKNGETNTYFAIVKEVKRNSINDELSCIDFYQVSLDEIFTTSALVHLVGSAPGVKDGGILEQITREIEIECLPTDIPDKINVDISDLRIGNAIHLKDIQLDQKIKVLTLPDTVLVTIVAPKEEVKEEVALPTVAEPEMVKKKEKEEEKDEK